MVVALFALSLVMILGGIASVVQGFPYVRLESGLAMVIGGVTAASAGAVLLGLAAVVMRLKQVEEAFGAGRDAALPFPPVLPREIAPLPPSSAPVVAGTAGLAGLTVGSAGLSAEPREPVLPEVPEQELEPVLPDLLPHDEPAPVPRAKVEPPPLEPMVPEPVSPEEDLFATPAAADNARPPLRTSLDAPHRDEPEPPAPEKPEVKPPADANPIVGTYASGANTYVMYADGTIEADTPRGRFTFDSLDELKTFVEAGGESDTRGAA